MKKILVYFISGLIVLNLGGCDDPVQIDLGYEYFPFATNQYRVYQTNVIHYSNDSIENEESYQIKEVMIEMKIEGDEINYKLERYRRAAENEEWVPDSTWLARKNRYTVVVVEHNVPFIKLSFPVEEGKRWNGNAMNINDYDEYKMVDVHKMFTIGDIVYPETVTIVKENIIDIIIKTDYRIEVFARGIGLVYKLDKVISYDYENNNPGTIVNGIEFSQKLIEAGEEI